MTEHVPGLSYRAIIPHRAKKHNHKFATIPFGRLFPFIIPKKLAEKVNKL